MLNNNVYIAKTGYVAEDFNITGDLNVTGDVTIGTGVGIFEIKPDTIIFNENTYYKEDLIVSGNLKFRWYQRSSSIFIVWS